MSEGPEELTELAARLRALAPSGGGLDRDELLYRAGRAAAPRRGPWVVASAVSTAVAAALALWLAVRPPAVVERVIAVPAQAPTEEPSSVPPEAIAGSPLPHLELQDRLIKHGLDGLGQRPAARPSILPPRGGDVP